MLDDAYEQTQSTVSEIMADDALMKSPEHRLGMSIQGAFSALDDIMTMAADPRTKHLVLRERIAMHQLVSRAQLIASFVDPARDQPGKVRMVVNNG